MQERIASLDIADRRLLPQHGFRVALAEPGQSLVAEVQIVPVRRASVRRRAIRVRDKVSDLRKRRIDRSADAPVIGLTEHERHFLPDPEIGPQIGNHLPQPLHIGLAQRLGPVSLTLVPENALQGPVPHRGLSPPDGFGIELGDRMANLFRIIPLPFVEYMAGGILDPLVEHRAAPGVDHQQHRPAGPGIHLPGKGDTQVVPLHGSLFPDG